jgi:hypothetical protein
MPYGTPDLPPLPPRIRVRDDYFASVRKRNGRKKVVRAIKAVAFGLLLVVLLAGSWLWASWWLMLGIGIAHLNWWPAMPTMGYGTALLIDIFIGGWVGIIVATQKISGSKK